MATKKLRAAVIASAALIAACAGQVAERPAPSAGQQIAASVPSNDIYLAPLQVTAAGISLGTLENITARPGYQNQPAFAPDGTGLWYTAIADGEQADLWWYDIKNRRHVQITRTPESEYSPTPLPDGSGLSTVRVEADGNQRLWAFSTSGKPQAPLLPDIYNVGYHHWLDDDTVALFIVGEPHQLRVATLSTGAVQTVASRIGRGMARVPNRNALSFVDKSNPEQWQVMLFDTETGMVQRLTSTRPGAEDFAWTPNAVLLMAEGKRLYGWQADSQWQLVADLTASLPGALTRVSVAPDGKHIALVAAEQETTND